MELNLKLANTINSPILAKLNLISSDYVDEIKEKIQSNFGLDKSEYSVLSLTGIKLSKNSILTSGDTILLCPQVLGGKGGFGSLLRAFGKQITKSTNKDACRDLTGRRIRHVNNEKKLKDFLSKQSDLAKKKEEEKKARLERKKRKRENLESSHHLFVDPKYDEQKQKITQDLDEAISKAIKEKKTKKNSNSTATESSSTESEVEKEDKNEQSLDKIKPTSSNSSSEQSQLDLKQNVKKQKEATPEKLKDWLGVGDLEVSSSSDDEEEQELNKKKKKY